MKSTLVHASLGVVFFLFAVGSAVAEERAGQWWPLPARGTEALVPVPVEGFEEERAEGGWSGYFGDDAAHRQDPASNYLRPSRKGEPVKEGKSSLRVGPIPPVPPYTRGFGHYFLYRRAPLERPQRAINLGLFVHGTAGRPSAIRLLYRAQGKKLWRTLDQDTSHRGWRWIAWPTLVDLGPRMVVAFDFINNSTAPLTWYVDGISFNREMVTRPVAAPGGLRGKPLPLHVELAWKADPRADLHGYWLFRSAGKSGEFRFVAPIPAGTLTYTDWDLPLDGGSFTYRLLAVTGSGRTSPKSETVTVEVPAFQPDTKLRRRLEQVVTGVIAERCGPRTRWGNKRDLEEWQDLNPEINFRTWFCWGAYETGWFPSGRLRDQPFKPNRRVVETVRNKGALFCAAVCCKYGNAMQVPLPPERSMAPYWTGFGVIRGPDRRHAFRDNTRLSRGLDLTVAHAVARLDAGADMLWFDMQPFDPADQRTLRNRLKWEALQSFRKGRRDSPDVLIGSDIYHQAFRWHPGRKDASCFDYRVEQGSKLFYENRDEAPYWGNSLLRDGAGRLMNHRAAGRAARLDASSTKINFCHGWLYYTGAGWTAGLYEKVADVPVLCFIDWANPTTDFAKVPARDQANFFRITAAELIACGFKFCFPVQAWDYNARKEGTYPVIRRLVHFYRRWADLYRDREIMWTRKPTSVKRAHSFPDCLTVKVGIEGGGGVMRNAGHAGLSYVVNDQPGPRRRIVHLFNHNFSDYKIVPQKGVALTIPSRHPVREVFLVSPDLPEKTSRRPVAFTWRDGVVRCRIDIAYYNVIVLEPR